MLNEEQKSMLRRLHGMLSFQDLEKPQEFKDFFYALHESGGIPVEALAKATKRDPRLVERWIEGYDIPPAAQWPKMVKSILELITQTLATPQAANLN